MSMHRVTLWHSSFEPVTSECKYMSINHGRWAGIMDFKRPQEEIKGKVWILNHETGQDEEYDSITAASTAIGMQLSVVRDARNRQVLMGHFDTERSALGKRSILRVDAEVDKVLPPPLDYHTREELELMIADLRGMITHGTAGRNHVASLTTHPFNIASDSSQNLLARVTSNSSSGISVGNDVIKLLPSSRDRVLRIGYQCNIKILPTEAGHCCIWTQIRSGRSGLLSFL